jgi:hypothetical protein
MCVGVKKTSFDRSHSVYSFFWNARLEKVYNITILYIFPSQIRIFFANPFSLSGFSYLNFAAHLDLFQLGSGRRYTL